MSNTKALQSLMFQNARVRRAIDPTTLFLARLLPDVPQEACF